MAEYSDSFSIRSDQFSALSRNNIRTRIKKLFNVSLERESDDLTDLRDHSDSQQIIWLRLTTADGPGARQNVEGAKKYLISLINGDMLETSTYPSSNYWPLVSRHDGIERESCAPLIYNSDRKTINAKCHPDASSNAKLNSDSRPFDSVDSNYESGALVSIVDSFGLALNSVRDENGSRAQNQQSRPQSDSDSEFAETFPDFPSKVEFALKRGYSKSQLKRALRKCGETVSENDLLSELITIGSQQTKTSRDEEEPDFDSVIETDSSRIIQRTIAADDTSNLRPIVIDGSNVSMSHGNKETFSCMGLKIVVDWFKKRGHQSINAFVPQWRKESSRPITPITGQDILTQLEKEGILTFTPSRRIGGKRVVCYDDRYIIKLAADTDAIVVSNDNYRDLLNESPEYKKVIEERLLMYCFVNNTFMPPDDPLGRNGPSLENFLRKEPVFPEPVPSLCPYGKKCTYGNKCRFYHPERKLKPQKSVTETIQEVSRLRMQEILEKDAIKKSDGVSKSTNAKRLVARTITQSHPIPSSPETSRPPPLPAKTYNKPDSKQSNDSWASSILTTTDLLDDKDIKTQGNTNTGKSPVLKVSLSRDSKSNGLSEHWSSDVHNSLRLTNSDPNRLSSIDDGGHLSLAKKLSDEGCQVMSCSSNETLDSLTPKGVASESSGDNDVGKVHRKLERQLTLKGSEDPRVKQKLVEEGTTSHSSLHERGGQFSTDVRPAPHSRQYQQNVGYTTRDPFVNYSAPPFDGFNNMPNPMGTFEQMQHQQQQQIQHRHLSDVRNSWAEPSRRHHSFPTSGRGMQSGLVERGTLPYPEVDRNSRSSWPAHSVETTYQPPPYTSYGVEYYHQEAPYMPLPGAYMQPPPYTPQQVARHTPHYPSDPYPITYSGYNSPPFVPSMPPPSVRSHPRPPMVVPTRQVPAPPMDENAPISPQDPRYSMYCNLVALFPEDKVRKIMNRYPEERNPRNICAHIIKI